jgi:hypothetical protein
MRKTLSKIGATLVVLTACLLPQICGAETDSGSRHGAQGVPFAADDILTSASSTAQLLTCAVRTDNYNQAISPSKIPIGLTMADFTGDGNPDLAAVEEENPALSAERKYLIEIQLTEGGRQFLEVNGLFGRLFVTAKDVTGDGTLDLIVRVIGSSAPVAVFLNDGCGHFSPHQPSSFNPILPGSSSGDEISSREPRFESLFFTASSYTAACENESRRALETETGLRLPSSDQLASASSSSLFSNRAPPTA